MVHACTAAIEIWRLAAPNELHQSTSGSPHYVLALFEEAIGTFGRSPFARDAPGMETASDEMFAIHVANKQQTFAGGLNHGSLQYIPLGRISCCLREASHRRMENW